MDDSRGTKMKAYLLSLNLGANIADQWDFGFLRDFLIDNNFDIENVKKIPNGDKAIVVIPARHHKGLEKKVSDQLDNLNSCVLFLMGDEEAVFDVKQVEHHNRHIWVQNPHIGVHDKYNKLGTGYPTHMKVTKKDKDLTMYFAGQVTHKRREELTDIMIDMSMKDKTVRVTRTKGFTQGETPEVYYDYMSRAKIVPAPSGAVIPDSFRLFEALECMAIPLADERTADGTVMHYWDWLFGESTPFPHIIEWDVLFGLVPELLEDYPRNIHHITAWYIKYKRDFKLKVLEQING